MAERNWHPPKGWKIDGVYARHYHVYIMSQKRKPKNGPRQRRTVDTKARLQYKEYFGHGGPRRHDNPRGDDDE